MKISAIIIGLGAALLALIGFVNSSNISSTNIDQEPTTNTTPPKRNIVESPIIWHWENRFEKQEVYQIKKWLNLVNSSVTKTLGKYPFKVHFYIHRSKNGNEPVPWAHTTRGEDLGVHFHVNMDYSPQEFLNDWTAAHEISHLSIPFVGKENAWFSEGYASYMQYQVMQEQGVYSKEEVVERYKMKFTKCKSSYQTQLPFPQAADSLKKSWNYPDMYWGGASFFWLLNDGYNKGIGQSLPEVITKYVVSKRVNESTPEQFCQSLDEFTKTKIASELWIQFQTQPAYQIFERF
jgi:hypothetical protein